MKAVPMEPKTERPGWVVCLVTGERVFIRADDYTQDETELVFYNGKDLERGLVIQFEKISIMWFMPNDPGLQVLISAGPAPGFEPDDYFDEVVEDGD